MNDDWFCINHFLRSVLKKVAVQYSTVLASYVPAGTRYYELAAYAAASSSPPPPAAASTYCTE